MRSTLRDADQPDVQVKDFFDVDPWSYLFVLMLALIVAGVGRTAGLW